MIVMEKKRKHKEEFIEKYDVVKKSKTFLSQKAGLLQTMAIPLPENPIENRKVKAEHKDLYMKNVGELTTSATPLPKKASKDQLDLSKMFSQMLGMSMPEESKMTQKDMLYEEYETTEAENNNLWKDAVDEYKDAYIQLKNLDLKPLRNLLHTVSENIYLVKTEKGKNLQKATVDVIYDFTEKRMNLLKVAPVPEKITDDTDVKELTHGLISLTLSVESISKDLKEEIERVIQTSRPPKISMFGEGRRKEPVKEAPVSMNQNYLEFIENEVLEEPTIHISKSAGLLFSVASNAIDQQILEIAEKNQIKASDVEVEIPDVRKDIFAQFETSAKQSPHIIQDLVNNYTSAYGDVAAIETKELIKIRQDIRMDKNLSHDRESKILKNELLGKVDQLIKDKKEVFEEAIDPKEINKSNFTCQDISSLNKIYLDYKNVKELYDEVKIMSKNNERVLYDNMYA